MRWSMLHQMEEFVFVYSNDLAIMESCMIHQKRKARQGILLPILLQSMCVYSELIPICGWSARFAYSVDSSQELHHILLGNTSLFDMERIRMPLRDSVNPSKEFGNWNLIVLFFCYIPKPVGEVGVHPLSALSYVESSLCSMVRCAVLWIGEFVCS